MVVMGEMLGEFVAGEIVVGDDSGHYAGCLEDDEVAVRARLRESRLASSTWGMVMGGRLRGGLDERPAALGESLVAPPEQVGDLLVEFGVDGRQGFGLMMRQCS